MDDEMIYDVTEETEAVSDPVSEVSVSETNKVSGKDVLKACAIGAGVGVSVGGGTIIGIRLGDWICDKVENFVQKRKKRKAQKAADAKEEAKAAAAEQLTRSSDSKDAKAILEKDG